MGCHIEQFVCLVGYLVIDCCDLSLLDVIFGFVWAISTIEGLGGLDA